MPSSPFASRAHLSRGDINIDGSTDDSKLIETSLNTLVSKGYGIWVGWSFAWASVTAARVGRKKMAWWTLRQLADVYVSCNTFNLNLDWERNGIASDADAYCQDGNMAAVAAVNEMLLQSWGGRIRVFPACPNHWREVRFDRLRGEGGMEVSAVRSEGRTLGVRLMSKSEQHVRLLNPFGPAGGYLDGQLITPNEDGDLVVALATGEAVWLTACARIQPANLDEFVVNQHGEEQNPYGLKYVDEGWFTDEPGHSQMCIRTSSIHSLSRSKPIFESWFSHRAVPKD